MPLLRYSFKWLSNLQTRKLWVAERGLRGHNNMKFRFYGTTNLASAFWEFGVWI